ncbi:MAG: nitroreductase family protein [Antricoccus sp.]
MGWERGSGQLSVELTSLLHQRWSSRVFDPEHVLSDEQLQTVLEAARWSPSAGNSQPWSFIVGRRGEPTHEQIVSALSRGNSFWAPRASAILISLEQRGTDAESGDFYYSDYAAYDLGQSAAHLTVQAMSMGLGVHQFAGFDHEKLTELFEVPAHWSVTTGIAIGKLAAVESIEDSEPSLAAKERRPRERKPLSEFIYEGRFGQQARWLR